MGETLSLEFGMGTYPLKIMRNFVSEIRYRYVLIKKLEELGA